MYYTHIIILQHTWFIREIRVIVFSISTYLYVRFLELLSMLPFLMQVHAVRCVSVHGEAIYNPESLINKLTCNHGGEAVRYLTVYTQNIWFSQHNQV